MCYQLYSLALIYEFMNMLYLPSHSSLSRHFLLKMLKDCQKFQWSYLVGRHPLCMGRSLKVVSARPVMHHVTDDVALLPILIYSSQLDSPDVREQSSMPEPTLQGGGRASEMAGIAHS